MSTNRSIEQTFRLFLEQQEQIYETFRRHQRFGCGVKTSPDLIHRMAGYLIALRYDQSVTDAITTQSAKIRSIVPAITYDVDNVHTTISDYSKVVQDQFEPDFAKLEILSGLVAETKEFLASKVTIAFREWLFNDNAVIVTGYPNIEYVEIITHLIQAAAKVKIDLRWPWGTHITCSRFLHDCSSRITHQELVALLTEATPLGCVQPTAIDVGYFRFLPDKYEIVTYQRFHW